MLGTAGSVTRATVPLTPVPRLVQLVPPFVETSMSTDEIPEDFFQATAISEPALNTSSRPGAMSWRFEDVTLKAGLVPLPRCTPPESLQVTVRLWLVTAALPGMVTIA